MSTSENNEITCLSDDMFRFSTMSVEHFQELQTFIDNLYEQNRITNDEIVRSYISDAKYAIPENFPEARSILLIAVNTPPASISVIHDGKRTEIILPPQYYASGVTREQLDATVRQKIIKNESARIEKAFGMLIKQIAVRSGLGVYGRNNLVYVDGFGTYHTLHAYLTDYEFEKDNFRDVKMMDACVDCAICRTTCPTQCIPDDGFVINAGRCLSVHSERAEPFPEWITSDMHNALVGCMRCQIPCPVTSSLPDRTKQMEALNEEETSAILSGDWDDEMTKRLSDKLKMFTPESAADVIPLLRKNLAVLLRQ